MPPGKPKMGGARPGAGRKPRGGGTASTVHPVRLAPEEQAELLAGLLPKETLSDVLREGGLLLVRARKPS